MSQLLSRLESELSLCTDPNLAAEIKARKSCYLSRIGHFSESRKLIADLRNGYGQGQVPRVAILVILAEGIADHFENLGDLAKDRIRRAQLLAMAINDRELAGLTSAWRAHIDFESSNFEAMIESLRKCSEFIDPDNHEAKSRAAMVTANCFYLCGDRAGGQRWFMNSREVALAAGDHATIEALLYNRAAFSMARLRAERCFGQIDSELLRLVQLEIFSSKNFQSMAQIESLKNICLLCEARILLLQEKFQEAYAALDKLRSAGPFAKCNFRDAIVMLEMAYCLHKLRKEDAARQLFREIDLADFEGLDVDDELAISWIRLQLGRADLFYGDASVRESSFNEIAEKYRLQTSTLHKSMVDFVAQGA